MAVRAEDEAYLLDLGAVVLALRGLCQEAVEAGEALAAQVRAAQDLDSRTAAAVTQAVARAEGQALSRLTTETARVQEGLQGQVQRLEAVARQQRWLPWRVGAVLLGVTLLVNAGVTLWWGSRPAVEPLPLPSAARLATDLDRHLVETLYPQLSKTQQRALDAVYKAAQSTPPGTRRK